MSAQSEAEKLTYVLTVLKHTNLAQPNYHEIAAETGVSNANQAQKRFKAIVEGAGFNLINKQVVGSDDVPATPTSTPSQKAKAAKPKKIAQNNGNVETSATKKRKIVEKEEQGSDSDVVIKSSPFCKEDED